MIFSPARTLALASTAAVAALAVVAATASATSIQTQSNGQPYTGALNMALQGNATSDVPGFGTITCTRSPVTAAITGAGGTGVPASGSISAFDLEDDADEGCDEDILPAVHLNNEPSGLPWAASLDWLSDNTGGTRNGTFTLSGVTLVATFDLAACAYRGDFGNSGGTSNQVQTDLFNPDNTASTQLELRFVDEPFDSVTGGLCPATVDLSATYQLTGAGAAKLQIRQPAQPASPSPAGAVAGKKAKKCKKRKKGRKGAVAAKKKKCKKKKKR